MGFGILVTVVLFSVALVFYEPANSSEPAETEPAVEEAKQEDTSTEETEEAKEESSDTKEEASTEDTTEAKESTQEQKTEESNTTVEKTTETKTPGKSVSFKVTAGESSYKVAENLYRAGLIDNPSDFNTYLEQNGYDNTIHVGTYNIPEGSTYEQIANTISK